jgi:hypothetical protein
MPILTGQYFECRIWHRKQNSAQYEDTYKVFHAKIVSNQKNNRNQAMSGVLNISSGLTIKTIDLDQVQIQDRIEILGERYQVTQVEIDKSGSQWTLGARHKTTEHMLSKLPKMISLT